MFSCKPSAFSFEESLLVELERETIFHCDWIPLEIHLNHSLNSSVLANLAIVLVSVLCRYFLAIFAPRLRQLEVLELFSHLPIHEYFVHEYFGEVFPLLVDGIVLIFKIRVCSSFS